MRGNSERGQGDLLTAFEQDGQKKSKILEYAEEEEVFPALALSGKVCSWERKMEAFQLPTSLRLLRSPPEAGFCETRAFTALKAKWHFIWIIALR